MTFRIDRFVSVGNAIVFRVCGRVQIECVNTIKELIEAENTGIVLDLLEVTLADGDAATQNHTVSDRHELLRRDEALGRHELSAGRHQQRCRRSTTAAGPSQS